ncbi:MAG: hypothetical protein WDZ62_01750 [Candidatus Pacearchaeota archaeon]
MKFKILFILTFFALFLGINGIFVSGQNITADFLQEVGLGEEFTITITLTNFSEGEYDVKFDTQKSGGNLLKVYNNGQWKSSFYYIKNAISNDDKKDFMLKSEDYSGVLEFEIRVRKSGQSTFTPSGIYEIKISKGEIKEETDDIENESENSSAEVEENEDSRYFEPTGKITEETSKGDMESLKIISLNPKDIKSEENSSERKINYPVYGFVAFSILIGILFLIQKRKYKNEFR